jgi:outer membrane protein, multidrug efflux system
MMRRSICAGLLLIAGLVGCTVGPNYHPPVVPLPVTWSEVPESGVTTHPFEVVQWWSAFQDPLLDSLIARAVTANLDLRVAQERVREARALRGVTAADSWPTLNIRGVYSRLRRSQNVTTSPSTTPGTSGTPGTTALESDLFQSDFDASWELDLFGRVRRSVEAAEANIAAAEENRRDVLVTLLAELARNYIELRGLQRQLVVTHDNIQAQQQSVALTDARFQSGLTSALDEAQLATTQSQVPALESAARQSIHRLGVLLGQPPETLLDELTPARPIPSVPPEVMVGLPSDLLRRRPDVRRAEQELAAATARIGVATADLFPHFSLTSNIVGLQSADIADLALASSRFWTAGPTLSWPIFDAGRIRANIEVQNAREEQALAQYEKTVLTALEDVEDALVAYTREQVRRGALMAAVEANQRATGLANERYIKGLGDFLNVLEAQRSLYASQDQLVQSERTVVSDLIALYKAVGGGWEVYSRIQ